MCEAKKVPDGWDVLGVESFPETEGGREFVRVVVNFSKRGSFAMPASKKGSDPYALILDIIEAMTSVRPPHQIASMNSLYLYAFAAIVDVNRALARAAADAECAGAARETEQSEAMALET